MVSVASVTKAGTISEPPDRADAVLRRRDRRHLPLGELESALSLEAVRRKAGVHQRQSVEAKA